jgi:hypothetical protein
MSPIAVSGVAFACILGSALAAMFGKRALPEHHLSADSKEIVKLGMGVIATLAALVLGLLIATTKGTYDAQGGAVKELAAKVLLLDRVLAKYGPETKEARELLRRMVAAMVDRIWPEDSGRAANLTPGEARAPGEAMYDKIAELSPQNEAQRALKARALDVTADVAQARLRLFAQQESSVPLPFLVVLVFWLSILFAGYGLLAPANATVLAVLVVCSLSIAGAIFLMLELASPFAGTMRVSSASLRDALALIGQ